MYKRDRHKEEGSEKRTLTPEQSDSDRIDRLLDDSENRVNEFMDRYFRDRPRVPRRSNDSECLPGEYLDRAARQ